MKSEIIVDFTEDNINTEVTHHNDKINIAFYKPIGEGNEILALQIKANKSDLLSLPDKLMDNLGYNSKDEYEDIILNLKAQLEEKDDIIEQYENNLQEYKDKLSLSCGPF